MLRRFEFAALLTVEQQRNSKTYYDSLLAWAIEVVSCDDTILPNPRSFPLFTLHC